MTRQRSTRTSKPLKARILCDSCIEGIRFAASLLAAALF